MSLQAIGIVAALGMLASVTAGLVGYHKGGDHVLGMAATATANATAQARADQQKVDAAVSAHDYAKTKADYETRLAAATNRNAAFAAITKNIPVLVPREPACEPVSATAMQKLNDPDLIGKDAQ